MIRPGSLIHLDSTNLSVLSEQWRSDKIEPSLRMVIIVCGMLYHALGSSRVTVLKLLGNTPEDVNNKESIHAYGRAADISVRELISSYRENKEIYHDQSIRRAQYAADRINAIFTCREDVAIYNLNHIHLQVPAGGFRKEDQSMATWMEFGLTGKHVSPSVPIEPTDLRY